MCGVRGLFCRESNPLQKECYRGFPLSLLPYALEQLIVVSPVRLEVETEIQQRLSHRSFVDQYQRNQEPAGAPIAIQERMDRLELNVREGCLHEGRCPLGLIVQELLQGGDAGEHFLRRRRDEHGVSRSGSSDPVLASAELPGLLSAAAPRRHEHGVDLPHKPPGKWCVRADAFQPILERSHIVGYFLHVVEWNARRLPRLKQEQVRKRRLRPLDLR